MVVRVASFANLFSNSFTFFLFFTFTTPSTTILTLLDSDLFPAFPSRQEATSTTPQV